jgi:hypothetical protein
LLDFGHPTTLTINLTKPAAPTNNHDRIWQVDAAINIAFILVRAEQKENKGNFAELIFFFVISA